MGRFYRTIYFWLLSQSIDGQLKYAVHNGARTVFFYERPDSPCGLRLLKFLPEKPDAIIGGIKFLGIIRNMLLVGSREIKVIYSGNISSKLLPPGKMIIEIQHGALDASYFSGLAPKRFMARARSSACIYESIRPDTEVVLVSNDLEPPNLERVSISMPSNPIFFSKNPGGGIERKQLAYMEQALCKAFTGLRLALHPRDNLIKLFVRHGFFTNIYHAYFRGILGGSENSRKLVISSYSTALFDKVSINDYVLNIADVKSDCIIKRAVYSEVPFLTISDLASACQEVAEVGKVQ